MEMEEGRTAYVTRSCCEHQKPMKSCSLLEAHFSCNPRPPWRRMEPCARPRGHGPKMDAKMISTLLTCFGRREGRGTACLSQGVCSQQTVGCGVEWSGENGDRKICILQHPPCTRVEAVAIGGDGYVSSWRYSARSPI
jgi:hypothetical protein